MYAYEEDAYCSDASDGEPLYDPDETVNYAISSEKRYTILNESDIRRRQDEEIAQVSSFFSLSSAQASALLCYYGWNVSKLHDEWFADEQNVRDKVGLFSYFIKQTNNVSHENSVYTCGICFDDDFVCNQVLSVGCGHNYCTSCWRTYISVSIKDTAAGCLLLRCPEPKCNAVVGRDMVDELVCEEEKRKYMDYFMRSYIEFRKARSRWCPAPGCNNAVEFEVGSSNYNVTCDCSHSFCFKCAGEPHRPVECNVVLEWTMKNNSEAENTKWILAYSKPCPKCGRPIEKNTGCNHMTCGKPCGYHFCWLCGKSLNGSVNYHCNCNRYEQSPAIAEKDDKRKRAKRYIQRYAHYYERWESNQKSGEQAMADLNATKTRTIQQLSDNVQMPETELSFVVKAWEQIVDCRRVLKWTYAYGFFKLENENNKRQLFEHLQGQAQAAVERLHHCVETELQPFLTEYQPTEFAFRTFKTKLNGLIGVTSTFFENLVRGLENGLSEVVSEKGIRKPEPERRRKGSSSSQAAVGAEYVTNLDNEDNQDYWSCDRCTFRNPGFATTCQVCFLD